MKRAMIALYLVPRNVGVVLLRVYRAVISPLYGEVCRYYPSCSAYALGAIQEHGLIVGSFFAARRVLRCHPWAEGGIDDVPLKKQRRFTVTSFGFVVPLATERADPHVWTS
jgi:putative membrane protein insertion efficiency factor